MRFIQFIGTQRSGSNLLRAMLNQLPQIAAPHPPHILSVFKPLLPIYDDISDDENFINLINDVCRWVELNPVPWKISYFNRSRIRELCKSNMLIELFYAIYTHYASLHNSEYACCKSMANVHFHGDLEKFGRKPYYIYLHRDGRDVACSFKKAIIGEKHVYHIAIQWRHDQIKAMEIKQKIPVERFFEVRYHDLITNTEYVLKSLCDFLGAPYNPVMLKYFNSEESIKTAKSGYMWKNLQYPVIKNNYNKYEKELSYHDIEIFERIAGDTLLALGYSVITDFKEKKEFTQDEIRKYDNQNYLLKNKTVNLANKYDMELRKPQSAFLEVLKNRLYRKSFTEYEFC